MNKKLAGAWIVHHCQKLRNVSDTTQDYEQIAFAGKCGLFLNALAATEQLALENSRVQTIAKANGISSRLELPSILDELHRQRLIDKGKSGIDVLGLTTAQTLEYTSTIFEDAQPQDCEKAAIELSEKASDIPIHKSHAIEFVSDSFSLNTNDAKDALTQYEQIGFIDFEKLENQELYFNGNLFRKTDIAKINTVLSSLNPDEERRVKELNCELDSHGCISQSSAISILGDVLFAKLLSIGLIDQNTIGNESGTFHFVTRPSAFSKFTNTSADDAFDLAKAFVTSLTYGMTSSSHGRGRIRMIEALMRKLIVGNWVGPATAIGQDYKVLEVRGVIQVRPYGDGRFRMKLLKKDVGQLALSVITDGEASTQSLLKLPSVSATRYLGPEPNRVITRKSQTQPLRKSIAALLNDLRTGGLR